MKPKTLAELAEACDGTLLDADPQALATGVSTDTRTLQPGDLFVALRGATHDGHDFAAEACAKGAVAVVVSRVVDVPCPRIQVRDTLIAYGRLGALARGDSRALVVAVTGTAGKTTAKDMIGAILGLVGKTLVTSATENNEIGVPRLMLALEEDHRYCVVELGMRGSGEIAYLADICRPHIGVITNIGEAHLGRLGSREAIAKAKAELLAALPPDGTAVLNADGFFFGLLKQLAPCPVVSFGLGAAPEEVAGHVTASDVRARGIEPARFTLQLGAEQASVVLRVPGRHNVYNALAAAAAASVAAAPLAAIVAGLESYEGAPMRSQVLHAPAGYVIINDAYNASPTSTPEALHMLGQCQGRRIFVFGEMLELGEASAEAHRQIGRLVAKMGVDWLVTVGPQAALAGAEAESAGLQVNAVGTPEEAVVLLKGALSEGDTVLVKASRGVALERVVESLLENA